MFLFSQNSLAYCIAYIRVNFTSKFSAFLGCAKFPREKKLDNVFVFHLKFSKDSIHSSLLEFVSLCELCFTYAAFFGQR
jgi:hypothetical protein